MSRHTRRPHARTPIVKLSITVMREQGREENSASFCTAQSLTDAALCGQKHDGGAYMRHGRFFGDIIGNISTTTEPIRIL